MLNNILSSAISLLKKLPSFINKYRYPIGGALTLLFFGFTIYRIDSLSSPDLNQDTYNAGILEQEKVVFDEAAIERINNLDERVVNPTENIDENRTNPF